ncbi:MAG: M1 family metallopeptidase [Acidobacteria bacterium]|nr:M1 family metallopeptidase [Acidobacteriota bacterium]
MPIRIFLLLLFTGTIFAQRLPQTVVPADYHLALDVRIAERTFSGDETIHVRFNQPAHEVVLNSLDLEIVDADVHAAGKTQKANVVYDKPSEMIRLELPQEIPAGEGTLKIEYRGKLTEGLRGLYLSKSSRRMYAVTQFEGTYARMMFPCFDEPSFKAYFDLSVTIDKGDTAISNGRISKDTPVGANRHQIQFSTSPKMSTYLVALAIGDWDCLSSSADGIPIRVCAVPEKKQYGAFALDVATHSLQFYDRWYGIKYPFGKLDMLAIPDYEWGGMENTASIFYRESALLFDEKTGSSLRKRSQATTIAHEIAHQWFGDLVTAAWWDDIWLNEGFATWMSAKPIEEWHPEWHAEEDAAASAQQIIGVDSLASARAIHGNPSTPSEIKEMFDGISYQKGAAVLRMLESYVGPEVFRKGVNAYLAAHVNGNATAADFWTSEAQASGKPIDKIMPTFVMQPGVPELALQNSCLSNQEKIDFTQSRFLISGERNSASQDWRIPVCVKTGTKDVDWCGTVIEERQEERLAACSSWLFGNRDAAGYYRVRYTPENLRAIAETAESSLNAAERIALVEDTWALTRAGKTSVADFMDLLQQLQSEQNRHVLGSIASHLDYIRESLVPKQDNARFDAFLRRQFSSLAGQVGWTARSDDTDEQKALRSTLLDVLGSAGDEAAIAAARKLVDQYLSDPRSVDSTLVGSAFTVASENGDDTLYKQLLHRWTAGAPGDAYNLYLLSLTQFSQPALIKQTLQLVDEGKIRQQDYPRFFGELLSNPAARGQTWSYLKEHWNDLSQKVTSFGGAGAVSALGSACDTKMRGDVQDFFNSHPAPGAQRAVQQSLERMDACVSFREKQGASFQQWIEKQ